MTRNPAILAEAAALKRAVEPFATLRALHQSQEWPALERRLDALLSHIQRHAPSSPPPAGASDRLRVVHWNLEHGNRFPQIEEALLGRPELADADLVMLNEVDLGMARSGNRDVAGELAERLGRYGAWTALFLETTVGRDEDAASAGGRDNQESFFGLAILSRWPIGETRRVELPSPEDFQFDSERMIGRHVGLVAEILRPGAPFVAVSCHVEVHRTRARRATQMRVLLESLRDERRPIVLAGDFNSHTFDRGRPWDALVGAVVLSLWSSPSLARRLLYPDRGSTRERLFDALRAHGFQWERYVDREPTLALRFERLDELRAFPDFAQSAVRRTLAWAERRGRLRLDWFAGRGWQGGSGFTVHGLDGPGLASDHAPIVADFE